jgi:hypothetical protein
MGIKTRSIVVAVALVGAGLVGSQTASAATPAKPTPKPTIVMTQPTFQSITPDDGPTSYPSTWDAGFTLDWHVNAPAGVCGQTITYSDYNTLGGDIDPILGYSTETDPVPTAARSYNQGDGYWIDFFRGGFNALIRATDCHGVKATSNAVHVVLQPGDDQDAAMAYSAGWAVANCTCWLGGTAHHTSTKNASVTFQTPKALDPSGVRLALLMPKGPTRGSAALYIDGVRKATINTYSATKVNGKITYQILLPGTATHTVKIVNLATAGHPRIDLDATINGG